MFAAVIIILIIAIISIILGVLLSKSGSSTGLSNLAGQDLEIFKKTKDRGIIKVMQMAMILLIITLLIIILVFAFIG